MKHVLQAAKHEIEQLRRRNEVLQAKVEVMDLFACVLHTSPATRNQAQCVDVAWELGKEIEKLEAAEKPIRPDLDDSPKHPGRTNA